MVFYVNRTWNDLLSIYCMLYKLLLLYFGRCYCHVYVVDGITTDADGITSCLARWQMLLPIDLVFVADGMPPVCMLQIGIWQMLLPRWQILWPPRLVC